MKNRNIENVKRMISAMALQVLALAGLFINKRIGAGFLCISILYTGICIALLAGKNSKVRVCRKCGMEFPKQYRVCPNCGNACETADIEREYAEVIERENERAPEETPEELKRNFERVEEISIEKALSLSEEDIEGILEEKMKNDDNVEL